MDTFFSLMSPKLLYTIRLVHSDGYGSSRYLYAINQFVDFALQGSYNFETLQVKCLNYLYRGIHTHTHTQTLCSESESELYRQSDRH
jgi:hypothetical protein